MNSKKLPPLVKSNSLIFGSAKEFIQDPLNFITDCHKQYGDSFRIKAGPKSIFVFSHPNEIQSLFTFNDEVMIKERGPRIVLGQTVLTSEGPTWKRQRKFAQSYFTRDNINSLIPEMHTIVQKQLDEYSGKVDLHTFSVKIMYSLVIKVIYGMDEINLLPNLSPLVDEMIDFVRSRPAKLIKWPLWLPLKSHRKFHSIKKQLFDHIKEIILKSKETHSTGFISFMEKDPDASEEEIVNQALTFFVASFETTANCLFWTLYLLTQDETKKFAVQNESNNSDLTINTLKDLSSHTEINNAIKESMRLYPPAWFRSRLCVKDTQVGEYFVPKGSTVWASIYLVQRNSEFWAQPNTFLPDRFLSKNLNRYAFIPFGGGKNTCIGMGMANLELAIIIKELFKKFDLTALKQTNVMPKAGITLSPSEEYFVNFKKR